MDYIGIFNLRDYSDYAIEYCDAIQEIFEKNKLGHIKRSNETYTFTELNINSLKNDDKKFVSLFYSEMKKILIDYQKKFFLHANQLPEKFGFEEIRIKKYDKNKDEQFRMHTDVGDFQSSKRFLAFQLYLNDVSQRGETVFPDYRKTIQPEKGKILVFPPLWTHLHCGNPPKSENKYILTSYLHYIS